MNRSSLVFLWSLLAVSATVLAAVAVSRLTNVHVEDEDVAMFI
jgi:hypothetical protein